MVGKEDEHVVGMKPTGNSFPVHVYLTLITLTVCYGIFYCLFVMLAHLFSAILGVIWA